MISFARQDLILRPIEKRLYLFADERSDGENKTIYRRSTKYRLVYLPLEMQILEDFTCCYML